MRHDVARRVQFGTALVHSTYGITALQWTCRARARDAGKANSYQSQVPVITWEQRYMTVSECARLQGLGDLSLDGLAPSRAFRAIGNAVSADLVRLIAANLLPTPQTRSRLGRNYSRC